MAKQYSKETKAAVLAELLKGQSPAFLSQEYDIPEGTIKNWKYRREGMNGVSKSATQKKERIGELIIDNLEVGLETATELLRAVADKKWIRTQDAAALATLYGVIQDKNYRILTALPDSDTQDTDL